MGCTTQPNSLQAISPIKIFAIVLLLQTTWSAASEPELPGLPTTRLMFIDADGKNLRPFLSFERATCGSPEWSPDGKLIAYDTWEQRQTYEDAVIEIVNVKTLEKRRLGKGAMPSWSPDGEQIVCHTYDTPQRTIVVMNVEGEGREQIMDHWGSPRWSWVGNRIIAPHSAGGVAIFDIVSGKEWKVLPNYRAWQGMGLSSDGKRICFGKVQGGIVVATLSDDAKSATAKTIADSGQSYQSTWSPDSKQVVINWQPTPAEIPQLYIFDIERDSKPRRLPGQNAAHNNHSPSWSPDGKTIVFAYQDTL